MNILRLYPHKLRRKIICSVVSPYTLIGPERMQNLYALGRRIEHQRIIGDVIECGVCNGGSAAILAHFATRSRLQRKVWLFDSFQGMPQTTKEDGKEAEAHIGKEVGDMNRVLEVLRAVDADLSRVRFEIGWYEQTFPKVSIPKIALLNIDADWYDSVKLCLDTFYDCVVPGGFISIDDYGHWPGCRQAVDEFFARRKIDVKLNYVDYTGRWFQKT